MTKSGEKPGNRDERVDGKRGGKPGTGQSGKDEPGTGKMLGVPYDWRKPNVARVKSRWWNPEDHRVLTPKAFGWGYDMNLYEVGRRLRLIRR